MLARTASGASGYVCFGIPITSSLVFPGAWPVRPPQPDATVVAERELPSWGETVNGGWEGVSDGEAFVVLASSRGEHRFRHGGRDLFHLTADHRTLLAAPGQARDTRWWRILLDSVLFTVSLLRGNEAIHAGAVATRSGAVGVVGASGAGKSTLLSQLHSQGHELVSDDILTLTAVGEQVLAHPGPPLMTLPRDAAGAFGTPIGCLGDEQWTAVPVICEPVPLRRLVWLDRRPGLATALHGVESPLGLLLTHLLRFPRTSARELSRFSLASAVAGHTELRRLAADPSVSPQQLAALALEGLSS